VRGIADVDARLRVRIAATERCQDVAAVGDTVVVVVVVTLIANPVPVLVELIRVRFERTAVEAIRDTVHVAVEADVRVRHDPQDLAHALRNDGEVIDRHPVVHGQSRVPEAISGSCRRRDFLSITSRGWTLARTRGTSVLKSSRPKSSVHRPLKKGTGSHQSIPI